MGPEASSLPSHSTVHERVPIPLTHHRGTLVKSGESTRPILKWALEDLQAIAECKTLDPSHVLTDKDTRPARTVIALATRSKNPADQVRSWLIDTGSGLDLISKSLAEKHGYKQIAAKTPLVSVSYTHLTLPTKRIV